MRTVELALQRVRRRPHRGDAPFLVGVVLLTVAGRLLLAGRPATPDEGGFLVVASQWHVGGSSLYGNYWVDRPPLLIGIFRIADLAGGLFALRVLGALLAAVTVVVLADAARRVFGIRAARWTALTAAAFLVSPLAGSQAVNGELLALPFLALGLRLAVEAVRTHDPLAARGAALGTGVAAILALLVKQNMADVGVFALVCWLVAWRTGRLTGRSCADLFALAAVGGGLGYAVVMLWAMAHGTSPLAVYEATYPFRVHAGRMLLATASERTDIRLDRLGTAAVLSGLVPVLLGFVLLAVRRTRTAPEVWGIVAAALFAAASIVGGGSYWLHYLVQAIPVTALALGAIAAVRRPATRLVTPLLAAGVVVSAVVSLVTVVGHQQANPGAVVSRSLESVARPGDTMVSAFGDGDIVQATGMSSPYPYLWSLPTRALDPDLTLMRGILGGPQAPTWVVVRGRHTTSVLEARGVQTLLDDRYRLVGTVCARDVYLRLGVSRPPLTSHGRCGGLMLP